MEALSQGANAAMPAQPELKDVNLGSVARLSVFSRHDILSSPDVLKVCSFIARQQAANFESIASALESRRHSFVGRILNFIEGEDVDLLTTPVCSYSKIFSARESLVPDMSPSVLEETLQALFKTGLMEPIMVGDVSHSGTGWVSVEGVRITDRVLFDAVI
jgi:hypothetical protein